MRSVAGRPLQVRVQAQLAVAPESRPGGNHAFRWLVKSMLCCIHHLHRPLSARSMCFLCCPASRIFLPAPVLNFQPLAPCTMDGALTIPCSATRHLPQHHVTSISTGFATKAPSEHNMNAMFVGSSLPPRALEKRTNGCIQASAPTSAPFLNVGHRLLPRYARHSSSVCPKDNRPAGGWPEHTRAADSCCILPSPQTSLRHHACKHEPGFRHKVRPSKPPFCSSLHRVAHL